MMNDTTEEHKSYQQGNGRRQLVRVHTTMILALFGGDFQLETTFERTGTGIFMILARSTKNRSGKRVESTINFWE
jgi:hypothetical protein